MQPANGKRDEVQQAWQTTSLATVTAGEDSSGTMESIVNGNGVHIKQPARRVSVLDEHVDTFDEQNELCLGELLHHVCHR